MTTTDTTVVRLQRTMNAPPERVYRAWLEPDLLRRWFAPGTWSVGRAEVDERVGGLLGIWQVGDDGEQLGGMEGEILELVPNERLVFAWRFLGPDRKVDPALDSRLTISLRAVDEGTELTLVHERLDAFMATRPDLDGKVSAGWDMVLENLAGAV